MTGFYLKCNTGLKSVNPLGYSPDRVNFIKNPNPMSFQCKITAACFKKMVGNALLLSVGNALLL